ncbi:MAG: hypothetical protein UY70_C0012G0001, partial [Candidatus Kaiserbacteria bacterium GW2011_GWB1_52_6]
SSPEARPLVSVGTSLANANVEPAPILAQDTGVTAAYANRASPLSFLGSISRTPAQNPSQTPVATWAMAFPTGVGTEVVVAIPTTSFGIFVNHLQGGWTRGALSPFGEAQSQLALAQAESNRIAMEAQINEWKEARDAGVCDSVCENSLANLERGLSIQQYTIASLIKRRMDSDLATIRTPREVLEELTTTSTSGPTLTQNAVRTFDPASRAAQLEKLGMTGTTTNALPAGSPLKSSLADIELLIQSETGTPIDLSPTSRPIIDKVEVPSQQFDAERQAYLARNAVGLIDSDHDGISDYDEVNLYHTNPRSAYSTGGALTDGEMITLGFDTSTSTLRRVPVESPIISGPESPGLYGVSGITVNSGTAEVATSITLMGQAFPDALVTLYVFSMPVVVTVKTDDNGVWTYTLDTELESGDHDLYVATVDATGKIIAKSPSVRFALTAQAAEFTPLLIGETPRSDPLDELRNNLIAIALTGFGVFAIIAVAILGTRRKDAGAA